MDIFRTLIVPADQAPLARLIAETLDPVNCSDMFQTGLSPTGDEPATHYISSGGISQNFAALVPFSIWQQDPEGQWKELDHTDGQPEVTYKLCQDAQLDVTLEQIKTLYASADVTAENPWLAMSRMDLQLVRPTPPDSETNV